MARSPSCGSCARQLPGARGIGDAFGPYAPSGAAHEAVRQWCSAKNHRLAGPNWEVYGHWMDERNTNPSRIRTDVYTCCQISPAATGWRSRSQPNRWCRDSRTVLCIPPPLGLRGS